MKSRFSSKEIISELTFSESIKTGERRKRIKSPFNIEPGLREYVLFFSLVLIIGILAMRLFGLQIIEGSYYRGLSDKNRVRTEIIHAQRGIVLDRSGKPLVLNVPGFRFMQKGKTRLIDRNSALDLIAQGKTLEIDSLREYVYRDAFSHVVGYIGQISQNELKDRNFLSYKQGELIGKMGIEKEYEKLLKGIDGKQLVEIDAQGKPYRKLGSEDPVPGKDIKVTLDVDLQSAAFRAMETVKKGALIATTIDGEILALISKPTFDPNLFTLGARYVATTSAYYSIEELLGDEDSQPLLNRTISGVYPPGSTFKLITAIAALQDGSIDADTKVEDTGVLRVGEFSFANWYFTQYGKTDGSVDVVRALARSNDIFFYTIAEKVGAEKLSLMAKNFGLGKVTGIDIPGEEEGIVPNEEWKIAHIGEKWYLGDTYHYGIGQGYLAVTPLQVNLWTQAVANNGKVYKPHVLFNTVDPSDSLTFVDPKIFDLVRKGMVESCRPGGVAWPLFEFKVMNKELRIDGKNFLPVPEASTSASFKDYREVVVACKTGTSEHGGEDALPHAWITLFAPAHDPQIVVTVLAESSGEGSSIAAPIAKKVLEEWFTRSSSKK